MEVERLSFSPFEFILPGTKKGNESLSWIATQSAQQALLARHSFPLSIVFHGHYRFMSGKQRSIEVEQSMPMSAEIDGTFRP
jgi:hypothetical protein